MMESFSDVAPAEHLTNGFGHHHNKSIERGSSTCYCQTQPLDAVADAIEPIAIVGLSFELPGGADSCDKLWDILVDGRSTLAEVPKDRWNPEGFSHGRGRKPGVANARRGQFLSRDVAAFDAPFFRITTAEAHAMDPQQRLLLETSYRALENAGISLEQISGSRTAVFMGTYNSDYNIMQSRDPLRSAVYRGTGIGGAMLANRLSWFFNLKGPSLSLDTGCSASLVALHLACQSILDGEADTALVGGCNLALDPDATVIMSDFGFLSRDGECNPFGQGTGTSRGEGCGVVVIKRLSQAISDKDTIRAVIRATGVNSDGDTPGITQPDQTAQRCLIQETYRKGGLDMSETRLFEAHGTGTPAGDPIEARAIAEAFENKLDPERPMIITGIKANIGHLENASGIASVIKVVLSLERGIIPPIARLGKLNSAIRDTAGLVFATEATTWPTPGIRRASINSFGYGGTNCHAVLDDAGYYLRIRRLEARHNTTCVKSDTKHHKHPLSEASRLFVLSAADENGCERASVALRQFVLGHQTTDWPRMMANLSYTLSERRSRLAWRSYLISIPSQVPQAFAQAQAVKARKMHSDPNLAYVFTGQGAQWATMGSDLLTYHVFRESLEHSERIFQDLGGSWRLVEELQKPAECSLLNEPKLSQPANTALQIALVDLLRSWLLTPAAVIGHSSGEIAAAYAGGLLSRDSALKIAYYRGVAADITKQILSRPAGMLAVSTPESSARGYIQKALSRDVIRPVYVACINSDKNVTLSGYIEDLDLLRCDFERDGLSARFVRTDIPYHSPLMATAATTYSALLGSLKAPVDYLQAIPVYSSTLVGRISAQDALDPAFWTKNLLCPVNFSASFMQMIQKSALPKVRRLGGKEGRKSQVKITHLVEMGPHHTLKGSIKDNISTGGHARDDIGYFATLIRKKNSATSLLQTAGDLYSCGYDLDILAVNGLKGLDAQLKMLTSLPEYDFNHTSRYWHESRISKQYRERAQSYHELLGTLASDSKDSEARWRHYISVDDLSWVGDHQISGVIVYPAAGLLVMALEAARQLVKEKQEVSRFGFKNVMIGRPLIIPTDPAGIETQLSMHRTNGLDNKARPVLKFNIHAYTSGDWFECCRGEVMIEYKQIPHKVDSATASEEILQAQQLIHSEASRTLLRPMKSVDFYAECDKLDLNYGSSFRALKDIRCGEVKQAVAKLDTHHWKLNVVDSQTQSHIIHPSTLDNILQLGLAALTRGGRDVVPTMMPTRVKQLWVAAELSEDSNDPGLNLFCKARTTGLRGASAEISALSSLQDSVMIEGSFELTTLNESPKAFEVPSGLCYKIVSRPDISLMSTAELKTYCCPDADVGCYEKERLQLSAIHDIEQQAVYHTRELLTQSHIRCNGSQSYMSKYISFLDRTVSALAPDFTPCKDLQQYINSVMEKFSEPSAHLRLSARITRHLNAILTGDQDVLELLFSDNLLTEFYTEHDENVTLRTALNSFIDILGHKNPSLQILEVGAGTGGASQRVLDALSLHRQSGDAGCRYKRYCYTDISPSFFEQARSRFSTHKHSMEFSVLDIEKDPSVQGFSDGDFDVVLASNVLHATADMDRTLLHINRLLKPGGYLVLLETTEPDTLSANIIFGLLPGWWLGVGKDRNRLLSPLLSESAWERQLKSSGFTGLDLSVQDTVNTERSLLISAKSNLKVASSSDVLRIVLVASRDSSLQRVLVDEVTAEISGTVGSQVTVISFEEETWAIPDGSVCVFIPELQQSCTWRTSAPVLRNLQAIVKKASSLIWLSGTTNSITDLLAATSIGLKRTLQSESSNIKLFNVTVELSSSTKSITNSICTCIRDALSLSQTICEDEYQEKQGLRYIDRIVPYTELDRHVATKPKSSNTSLEVFRALTERPICLTIGTPGFLESLRFMDHPTALLPLGESEIEIEVHAVGLNFRDVLLALAEIDNDDFGSECSGIVRRRGRAVSHLDVGDRVICLMSRAFTNIGRCPAATAIKLPERIPMTAGAGMPVVAATAIYALTHVGKIRQGESILIHSGAGGLGQAAIQIARSYKATIYTTVGTMEKKVFLHERYGIPMDHIFSSRTLAFMPALTRLTGGKGVNLVLNSLSGEALQASVACLAPYGRFLETGKRDIMAGSSLPMSLLARNASFSVIDLATITVENAVLCGTLLTEAMELVERNAFSVPEPLNMFSGSEIEKAFRLMQTGKHMGKIVINFTESTLVPTLPSRLATWSFDPQASYVIAGGFGGIGRSISRWMADRGARNLIFLSRRTRYNDDIQQLLNDLTQQSVSFAAPPCDISDRDSLRAALKQCVQMPPIKGCLQLQMVVRGGEFQDLSLDAIHDALTPKIEGSFNLHEELPTDLDFFVMFSSVAGIMGTPGLSPYAMGNVYQDRLARYRVSRGMKAVSLDLGIVFNAGYVSEERQVHDSMRKIGLFGITYQQITDVLDHYCDPRLPVQNEAESQVIVGLETLAQAQARGGGGGPWFRRPLFSCMNQVRLEGDPCDGTNTRSTNVTVELKAARTHDEAAEVVLEHLVRKLVAMLGIDKSDVEVNRPLHILGIDSLVGIEIRSWFSRLVGAEMAVFEISGNVSIADLVALAITRSKVTSLAA